MAYKDMFTVLVVDSRIERSQSLRDALGRILGHLREDHHLRTDVLGTTRDAVVRLRNDASVACLLLEWGGKTGGIDGQRVVEALEDTGLEIPVFLLAPGDDLGREQHGLLVDAVRGLIYPEEDAPDCVAKYINLHFEAYIEQLKPPFFGRIIEFNEASNEMWTCPGHNGGMFYRRSPVGRVFYEYLGETIFRTDLDNSVVELGDLLVHEGPRGKPRPPPRKSSALTGRTSFSTAPPPPTRSPPERWSLAPTLCSLTATTTSPITTAPWCWAAASPSTCRPTVIRRA
jgi:ornithine decarboxylase